MDESGNSGKNLAHPQQPVFTLAALPVAESAWIGLESGFQALIEKYFPAARPDAFEVHANELVNPRGFFRAFPVKHRMGFFVEALQLLENRKLQVIQRSILKERYLTWLKNTFGPDVLINPHLAAFPLVAHVVNDYLKSLNGSPLGIFISDENRDIMFDVEKTHQILRDTPGRLHLGQIIEKGFFIDSRKSLLLQMADLCAYACRRMEEKRFGFAIKPFETPVLEALQPLLYRGVEATGDVLVWLESEQKRSGQGPKPRGR